MKVNPEEYGLGPADLKKMRRKKGDQKKADLNPDRLPPHSVECEEGVISCCLRDPVNALSACEEAHVQADWFYDLKHGLIFSALKEMSKEGVAIDLISVQQWLRDAGQLNEVGGVAGLVELEDAAPSAANLPVYLETVREKFQLRTLGAMASTVADRVLEFDGEVPELLEEVEQEFRKVAEANAGQAEQAVKEILPAVADDLENYHRGGAQMRGLSTGLRYVDKMLCGIGGEDNNMIVFAGRPGTGKTSLALDITLHVALDHPEYIEVTEERARELEALQKKISATREGKFYHVRHGLPVAWFSMEMPAKALVRRMAFQRAQADAQRWRTGFAEAQDFMPLTRAMGEIAAAKIFIDYCRRCPIDQLKARARRMKRQHGVRLFVLDYLQLMQPARKKFRDDRVQELADISAELQALGNELETPFIILAQMNRDYEKEPNREPRLSDLKDCGAIEQDADVVGFLHTPKKADEDENYLQAMEKVFGTDQWQKYPKPVDLLIAKARNGPTGPAHLLFQKSCMHFWDRQAWMEEKAGYQRALGEKAPGGAANTQTDFGAVVAGE